MLTTHYQDTYLLSMRKMMLMKYMLHELIRMKEYENIVTLPEYDKVMFNYLLFLF